MRFAICYLGPSAQRFANAKVVENLGQIYSICNKKFITNGTASLFNTKVPFKSIKTKAYALCSIIACIFFERGKKMVNQNIREPPFKEIVVRNTTLSKSFNCF